MGYAIVRCSNLVEKKLSGVVPGTGCALVAILSTTAQRLLKTTTDNSSTTLPFLSSLCFHLLFAAVGVNADLSQIASRGVATTSFAATALCFHVGFVFGVTRLWNKLCGGRQNRRTINLEELAVASNAAVGGPGTAAAFAANVCDGQQRRHTVDGTPPPSDAAQRGLVLGATVYGIVGYAVGTSVGVSLTKLLQCKFC